MKIQAVVFSLVNFFALSSGANQSVDLVVKVPRFTPAGPVYITGSLAELGSWRPDGVALRSVGPFTYLIHLDLADGVTGFDYKMTRGDWSNEAADPQSQPLSNAHLDLSSKGDPSLHTVVNWRDLPPLGVTGQLIVYPAFHSPELGNDRAVRVWLPPSYSSSPEKRYAVLYMHDGQNVFDPKTSFNGVDWGVDETLTELIGRGETPEVIVVGLDSTPDRTAEYEYNQRGNLYGHFLADTVKPFVDRNFRTQPGRDSTYLMGSSMGALISVALVWKQPEIFSVAAGVSMPAWAFDDDMIKIIASSPKPKWPVRIYFDHGTGGDDATYAPSAKLLYQQLLDAGMAEHDLNYRIFPYAEHNEAEWARRVDIPLVWMLN